MQPIIPIILLVVGIICATTMYFNMMHTIEMKSLRKELSSAMANYPDYSQAYSSNNDITMENFNQYLYNIIKQKVSKYLVEMINDEDKIGFDNNKIQMITNDSDDDKYAVIKYDKTPIGKNNINYADKILGAYITEIDAESAAPENFLTRLGLIANDNSPDLMLYSSMEPGDCYAFKNTKAIFTINLVKSIFIEAIELMHISKYMSPSKSTESAPRYFRAYILNDTDVEHHLGDYEYDNRFPYQIYKVNAKVPSQRIRFQFSGNHGHPNFTCIYRIAVYGMEK